MSDSENKSCATIVEILIPGPQGPAGTGSNDIGGYAVALENITADQLLIFNGEVWENRPASGTLQGDMLKSVYDTNDDGKVDVAAVADAAPWSGITDKPETFPPSSHVHEIEQVTGLENALSAKAPLASPAFTGAPAAPTADPGTSTGQLATTAFVSAAIGAIEIGAPEWENISDKPSTFPPAPHSHAISDVTGLEMALAEAGKISGPDETIAGALAFFDDATGTVLASGEDTMTSITSALSDIVEALSNQLAPSSATLIWGGADNGSFVTAKALADANAPSTLNASLATVEMDLAEGLNFSLELPGNRTLANPTNARPGQSGSIWVTRSAPGATLSFGSNWRPVGGYYDISENVNEADLITFFVAPVGIVAFSVLKGFEV